MTWRPSCDPLPLSAWPSSSSSSSRVHPLGGPPWVGRVGQDGPGFAGGGQGNVGTPGTLSCANPLDWIVLCFLSHLFSVRLCGWGGQVGSMLAVGAANSLIAASLR